jgi:hypothetical protein
MLDFVINGSPNITICRDKIFVEYGSGELMLQGDLVKPSTGNWVSYSFTLEWCGPVGRRPL